MLVTFHTKSHGEITMFNDVAIKLIKLMGHSGTVPSAMEPEDIPGAMAELKTALSKADEIDDSHATEEDDDDSEEPAEEAVSLQHRALPLIELFETAERNKDPVIWDHHRTTI